MRQRVSPSALPSAMVASWPPAGPRWAVPPVPAGRGPRTWRLTPPSGTEWGRLLRGSGIGQEGRGCGRRSVPLRRRGGARSVCAGRGLSGETAPAVPCLQSSFEAAPCVKCRGLCLLGGFGAVPVVHLKGWELLERSLTGVAALGPSG